jgi:hypothetical protein
MNDADEAETIGTDDWWTEQIESQIACDSNACINQCAYMPPHGR